MKISLLQRTAILLIATLIAACASKTPAPVVDRGGASTRLLSQGIPSAKQGEFHTVKKGETLYSIALEYGQSYQDVAAWNSIENPNMLKIGQRLRIAPPEGAVVVQPVAGPTPVEVHAIGSTASANSDKLKHEPKGGKQPYSEKALATEQQPPASQMQATSKEEHGNQAPDQGVVSNWIWPSKGKVLNTYVEGSGKGIDLEGRIGDPVLAAETGKVTYAGSGIRGYGNLLIIQHANGLSSVYAHNSKLLVKEKDAVAKGQKIAEVGDSDADQAMLHFEIRRQGKPLDPLKLLPQR